MAIFLGWRAEPQHLIECGCFPPINGVVLSFSRADIEEPIPWVFFRLVATHRGGPKEPRPILTITKSWKSACLKAGLPGRIPHDLRRTAIRNLVRTGISERVAMRLTSHKTRSVFERYNIVSDGDLHDAAEKLDRADGVFENAKNVVGAG